MFHPYYCFAGSECEVCGAVSREVLCCERCDLHLCRACHAAEGKPPHPCTWMRWKRTQLDRRLACLEDRRAEKEVVDAYAS